MTQPTLFESINPEPDPEALKRLQEDTPSEPPVVRARGSDPETSHRSMAALDLERISNAADVAAELHRRYGGMADFEFRDVWAHEYLHPCSQHLYRQARSIARDRGQIRDSGLRKLNPTSNRQQVVWEACEQESLTIEKCSACGHVLRRRQTNQEVA